MEYRDGWKLANGLKNTIAPASTTVTNNNMLWLALQVKEEQDKLQKWIKENPVEAYKAGYTPQGEGLEGALGAEDVLSMGLRKPVMDVLGYVGEKAMSNLVGKPIGRVVTNVIRPSGAMTAKEMAKMGVSEASAAAELTQTPVGGWRNRALEDLYNGAPSNTQSNFLSPNLTTEPPVPRGQLELSSRVEELVNAVNAKMKGPIRVGYDQYNPNKLDVFYTGEVSTPMGKVVLNNERTGSYGVNWTDKGVDMKYTFPFREPPVKLMDGKTIRMSDHDFLHQGGGGELYKVLNEELKARNLGNVWDGGNGKSGFSQEMWEHWVKTGKAEQIGNRYKLLMLLGLLGAQQNDK